MPKMVDATVWNISQQCRINAAMVWESLAWLIAEKPAPSPDATETYYDHWKDVALTLEREFGL